MRTKCYFGILLVSVIFGPGIAALDGLSLLDDLLLPYEFHPANHIRRIRSLQNPKYNYTYEVFTANVTENILPIATTRYFVSDVSDPVFFYKKVKAYGHMTTVSNPLRSFSVLEPQNSGGCSRNTTETVENSAKQRNCYVAQNGGFFNTKTGSCLGNLVSDSRVIQTFDKIQNANFGIAENGSIVVGYLSTYDIERLKFKQLIGGAIWLVRNGESYVEDSFKCESAEIQETGSLRTFIDVQSARTAVGHDSSGRVVLVNVEGQTGSRGVNLNQFAKLLIDEFHLVNAINLDGGGSATLVLNGTLASYPSDHCQEAPEWRCARAITTILCIHDLDCDYGCDHGRCIHGSCICDENYRGRSCEELYCHHHNCSQHGTCTPEGCLCDSGWHGADCTAPCGSKYFGLNCSQECQCQNNASCDSVTGTCSCLPGFEGALCDKGCPVGRYGRSCTLFCHCGDTCYCDAITGVCSNNTMQSSNYDATMAVSQCLTRKRLREIELTQDAKEAMSFHWMAIVCTTVGILALSLLMNVYLLLACSTDVTISHCCDTEKPTDYLPLRNNHLSSDSSPGKSGSPDCDVSMEQRSSNDVTINMTKVNGKLGKIKPSSTKTRPYSMSGHRKMRGKRKSRDFRPFTGRRTDRYNNFVPRNVVYEETALLSES